MHTPCLVCIWYCARCTQDKPVPQNALEPQKLNRHKWHISAYTDRTIIICAFTYWLCIVFFFVCVALVIPSTRAWPGFRCTHTCDRETAVVHARSTARMSIFQPWNLIRADGNRWSGHARVRRVRKPYTCLCAAVQMWWCGVWCGAVCARPVMHAVVINFQFKRKRGASRNG